MTPWMAGDIGFGKSFGLQCPTQDENQSTTLNNIELAKLSKGMEIMLSTASAARPMAFSNLVRETCTTTREHDCFNLRSRLVSIAHVSKFCSVHLLTDNLSFEGATNLNNEANSIDPSSFLPKKKHARSKKSVQQI